MVCKDRHDVLIFSVVFLFSPSGVRTDVVIEEDWTKTVIPAPMPIARYPLRLVARLRMRFELPRRSDERTLIMTTKQTTRKNIERKKQTQPLISSSDCEAWF